MKLLQEFLIVIRSWPEEARRFLAGTLVGIAAISLFTVLGTVIPSRLQNVSAPGSAQEPENLESVPGPLESFIPRLEEPGSRRRSRLGIALPQALTGSAARVQELTKSAEKKLPPGILKSLWGDLRSAWADVW